MGDMGYPVDHRIPHVHVGRSHIDLGPEHLLSVFIFSFLHLFKKPQVLFHKPQVLFHRALPVGAVLPGLSQSPPVFPDLICRQVADISLSLADQLQGALIHHVEIVGRKVQVILPVRPQPFHIFLDGLHELRVLLGGIGIVKPQMEGAVIFLRQSGIQKNGFGVSDVEISVRLRRETGADFTVHSFRQVFIYFLFDKILGNCLFLHVLPPHRAIIFAPYLIIKPSWKQAWAAIFPSSSKQAKKLLPVLGVIKLPSGIEPPTSALPRRRSTD